MINLIPHQIYPPIVLQLAYAMDKIRKSDFDNFVLLPSLWGDIEEKNVYLIFNKINEELEGPDALMAYVDPKFL